MIPEKALALLRSMHPDLIGKLYLEDAVIGLNLSAVLLSDGSAGVASTFMPDRKEESRGERDLGEFSPGMIRGFPLSRLFEEEASSVLVPTLRIAALNALSTTIVDQGGYKIIQDVDPMDLIALNEKMTVTLVGAFSNYIRRVLDAGCRLQVLELKEEALDPDHRRYYLAAQQYAEAFSTSDVIIITGLTLVNNTLDSLLQALPAGRQAVIVGPSGNMLPDVLFAQGISIIGGTRITDTAKLFELAGQGASGYHLFRYCARKICIINEG